MKHDVITVKLTCHIPIDRDDRKSSDAAYDLADELKEYADELGQTIMETRLNRVTAPEPTLNPAVPEAPDAEPPDNLDIPDNLKRAKHEPAAAE